jgi:D-tyrosyl-tRNA(Tyr) deacylase
VVVENQVCGAIGTGLLVLVGIGRTDAQDDANYCVEKVLGLRIFPDERGKMNRSVIDAGGSILVVSQFTLYGDCRRGRRPGFDAAAAPADALSLYNYFVQELRRGPVPVETGIFQAAMDVRLVNHGPVTLWIDTADRNNQ